MKLVKPSYTAIAIMAIACAASASLAFWAWREYTFVAGAIAALLLFGGATLLPDGRLFAHSVSLGLMLGFAVGSGLALATATLG